MALEAPNAGAVPKTHPHNTRYKKIPQVGESVEGNQQARNVKGPERPKRRAVNSEVRQTRRGEAQILEQIEHLLQTSIMSVWGCNWKVLWPDN